MDIYRDALVITRDEIRIQAPPERVWELFTNITAWPEWQPEITSARLDEPLAVNTTFHWSAAGMDIASTVAELIPGQRIVWSGLFKGIMAVHVWTFTAVEGGTLVQTAESWDGASVRPQAKTLQTVLDRSLRVWLEALKNEAER